MEHQQGSTSATAPTAGGIDSLGPQAAHSSAYPSDHVDLTPHGRAASPALPPRPAADYHSGTPSTLVTSSSQQATSSSANNNDADRTELVEKAVQEDAQAGPDDMTIEEAHAAMPQEDKATIGFIIPFPVYTGKPDEPAEDIEAKQALLPPFLIYTPPPARLTKPGEGEKESMVHKAQRKWEEEEDGARGKSGLKAKAVGLIGKGMSMTKSSGIEFLTRTPSKKKLIEIRLMYPAAYPSDSLKEDFNKLIKQTKKGARKGSIIATTLAPFALAFDTVTFIPGPFEICCVWASSSWVGTARATAIANGVTSDKVPLNFAPSDHLHPLTFRLHELVAHSAPKQSISAPSWSGQGAPRRGPELAAIILDILKEQLNGDISAYNTDRSRVAEDIEDILYKSAKEYVKALKDVEDKLEKERKEQAKKAKKSKE